MTRLLLRLSLWLGYRRQRIIRRARAEAAHRGWQTRRIHERSALGGEQ